MFTDWALQVESEEIFESMTRDTAGQGARREEREFMDEMVVGKAEHNPFPDSFESQSKPARHWRSRSAPDSDASSDNWDMSPGILHNLKTGWTRMKMHFSQKDRQATLKQDVAQLEQKLHDQLAVREALENALGRASTFCSSTCGNHIPKQTEETIQEIALLESEVARLEQHLLLLYRKVFDENFAVNPSKLNIREDPVPALSHSGPLQQSSGLHSALKQNVVQRSHSSLSHLSSSSSLLLGSGTKSTQKQADYAVQRSLSSLSHVSSSSTFVRCSPPLENSPNSGTMHPCHSQPLIKGSEGRVARLADHLGTSIANHVPESPNRLSEDLVHCMAAIYCKLAEPPLPPMGFSNSPTSSLSSSTIFSPQDQPDSWSPRCSNNEACEIRLTDPFQVKGQGESIGAYNSMIEVPWICVDNDRLSYAARMLHNFKSLVRRLEKVEPKKLKHEEKLAFWINVYNALMMHAYLAYGIPRKQLKRIQLLLKAAYKVGGQSINAHIIENTILGCRLYRPAQWLQSLLLSGMKAKGGEELRAYALEQPEPLVCFALCSGSSSDPAVRVYTAKNVYQELEVAKEEYLQASIGIRKENKILLPRVLEGFSREASLSLSKLVDVACQSLPEAQRNAVRKCSQNKPHKSIEWLPYNFSFRYIFSRELARWTPPLIP